MTNFAGVFTVLQFAALLTLGANAASVLAVVQVTAAAFAERRARATVLHDAIAVARDVASLQAAGLVYVALVQVIGPSWPMYAVPLAAVVITYAAVHGAVEALVHIRGEAVRRMQEALTRSLLGGVLAIALAAGIVELVEQRHWAMLALLTLPLSCAFLVYRDYVARVEADAQRGQVVASLSEGIACVDDGGRVTLWSDTLQHLLDCQRDRAMGSTLAVAVPALAKTTLPKAIEQALRERTESVVDVTCALTAGSRQLQIKVLPTDAGATLVWRDVTEERRERRALQRHEQRLALAADGASDGLWEWDLTNKEFFTSRRWKASLGLPVESGVGRPEDWLGRVHPEDVAGLKQAIEAHLTGKTDFLRHDHRVLHEDGGYRWFSCHAVAARGTSGRSVRLAGSLTDATERVLAQERLRSAGFLDPLTKLCNRTLFVESLGRRLAESQHRIGRFALLYLDLDRFKVVNDSLGHLVGDELLVAVARRLESCVRPGDSLARLGGDEFAILLDSLADDQQANALAFQIQEALRTPLSIGGREVFTSASIGIALGPALYADPDEIMRDADTAMYHAKSNGKARHEVFDAEMHARVRDRLGLESDLRNAVSTNNFEVHYQPIVLLPSGMCVGFESLVRWTRHGTPVSPATFIPIAEELGLIESIGTWVMQEACRTFAEWQRRHPDAGLDYITVNVSSRQLTQPNFIRVVERALEKTGLNPADLRLEITETALMDSPTLASQSLRELRDLGVKIYLDDFGTGYSSLSHLHKLPVDALKIDRSFVKSLLQPDRPAIVESVLALARTLNTSVVAEGIESDRQARELERLGCTHAQGFLFSRPLPEASAEAVIAARQPLGPKPAAQQADMDPQLLVPSTPFEWPTYVTAR